MGVGYFAARSGWNSIAVEKFLVGGDVTESACWWVSCLCRLGIVDLDFGFCHGRVGGGGGGGGGGWASGVVVSWGWSRICLWFLGVSHVSPGERISGAVSGWVALERSYVAGIV
jgi:hypothetical protein